MPTALWRNNTIRFEITCIYIHVTHCSRTSRTSGKPVFAEHSALYKYDHQHRKDIKLSAVGIALQKKNTKLVNSVEYNL